MAPLSTKRHFIKASCGRRRWPRSKIQRAHRSNAGKDRSAGGAEIGRIMKSCGWDWLFIDLEHGSMSLDTASQISVAALDAGIAPIVRVPQGQLDMATRALDGGGW